MIKISDLNHHDLNQPTLMLVDFNLRLTVIKWLSDKNRRKCQTPKASRQTWLENDDECEDAGWQNSANFTVILEYFALSNMHLTLMLKELQPTTDLRSSAHVQQILATMSADDRSEFCSLLLS